MKNLLQSINALKRKWLVFACALMVCSSGFGLTINTNTTWSSSQLPGTTTVYSYGTWDPGTNTMTMSEAIIVDRASTTRVTFTIDGIRVEFNHITHGITVQEGEILIIQNGGTLYSTTAFWVGIIADGVSTEPQFDLSIANSIPDFRDPFNGNTAYDPDQTRVMIDNSTVQKARWGVKSDEGAIVICTNSTFDDCEVSVSIQNYIQTVNDDLRFRNASYISDCDFNMLSIIAFPFGSGFSSTYQSRIAIELVGVQGIHIQGVTVQNTDQSYDDPELRGYGVYSTNSNFTIHTSGTRGSNDANGCYTYNGNGNTMQDISFGVFVKETTGSPYPEYRSGATIWDVDFTDIPYNINVEQSRDLIVKSCSLDMKVLDRYADPLKVSNPYFVGVNANTVEKVLIWDNDFFGQPLANAPSLVNLVRLNGCGSKDNKVYQNRFSVDNPDINGNTTNFKGVFLEGNNSRVEIGCNTFTSVYTGIEVALGANAGSMWENKNVDSREMNNNFSGTRLMDLTNFTGSPIQYTEEFSEYNLIVKNTLDWQHKNPVIGETRTCNALRCDVIPIGLIADEVTNFGNVDVYPNPVIQEFFIEFEQPFTGTIVLTDIAGKMVKNVDVKEALYDTQINITGLANGMYILQLRNNEGASYLQKIIVDSN